MNETCPRFGKWIGGCRFEPRYDERKVGSIFDEVFGREQHLFATVSVTEEVNGKTVKRDNLMPESTKTYVRDICTRCGRTVKRT